MLFYQRYMYACVQMCDCVWVQVWSIVYAWVAHSHFILWQSTAMVSCMD